MRRRILITSIGLTLGAYGCAKTYGQSEAPDAASEVDGSSDGFADADSDATNDGQVLDAGCDGYPTAFFCDSFDDGPLGARWTRVNQSGGGLVALSTAEQTSLPGALLSTVQVTAADAGAVNASLELDLAIAPARIRSSFDLYLDALTTRSSAIGTISLRNGIHAYDISLFASESAVKIDEQGDYLDGGTFDMTHSLPAIAMKTWTRVILDVDYAGSTITLTLQQPPGAPSSPQLDHVPITPTIAGMQTVLFAGVEYLVPPTSSGVRVYVDNVVFETP